VCAKDRRLLSLHKCKPELYWHNFLGNINMLESEYTKLREALVDQLRIKGIRDEKILAAFLKVERHKFINSDIDPLAAYEDKPLDIGEGQTISQPFTVAYQTQLLDLEPGDKVLEIGTGSGYQSAILMELGAELYSIERQEKLSQEAKQKLQELGYTKAKLFYGDGNLGLPQYMPFDKVIITAAAPGIPFALIKQMKIGGKMVVPVNGNIQRMKRIIKIADDDIHVEDRGAFYFVPLLPGIVMDKV
jgi:protein-L-isoaspartate(D-aspartate) O-methyltransferase